MTGNQRILAAFRHEPTDRLPLFEQSVANSVASQLLGRQAFTGTTALHRDCCEASIRGREAYDELMEHIIDDTVALADLLGHDAVSAPWLLPFEPTKKIDELNYLCGDPDKGPWRIRRFDPASQTLGTVKRGGFPETERDIEREVETAQRRAADAQPTPRDFPLQKTFLDRVGDRLAVFGNGGLQIPMETIWLEMTALRPDLVEGWLDAAVETSCRDMTVQAAMGMRVIWAGGDLADNRGSVYGPRVFRDLFLPRLQKITKCARELGLFYLFRSDGNLWSIADDLFVASGVHGYGEIDVDAGMDLLEVRRRYPKLTLWGGISCGKLMLQGSADQVRAETRRVVEGLGRIGHILGTSNSVLPGTPPENVMAMVEESQK
ncbi:MAG: hypothetical protein GWP05_09620 [Anaerolineaceae bacterium]|nr:hypothetical protein [Anaerolineaceae bacterium]